MSQDGADDLRQQVCLSLRRTLAYLESHAHLRALFSIQELLSRHAADVAWQQSQQSMGPIPTAYQELPVVLRDQLAAMERQQHALHDQDAQRVLRESRNVAEP